MEPTNTSNSNARAAIGGTETRFTKDHATRCPNNTPADPAITDKTGSNMGGSRRGSSLRSLVHAPVDILFSAALFGVLAAWAVALTLSVVANVSMNSDYQAHAAVVESVPTTGGTPEDPISEALYTMYGPGFAARSSARSVTAQALPTDKVGDAVTLWVSGDTIVRTEPQFDIGWVTRNTMRSVLYSYGVLGMMALAVVIARRRTSQDT